MEDTDIQFPDSYQMCCGKQKCPTIQLKNDADGPVLLSAPTPELEWFGGFEEGVSAGIRLTPAQATDLRKWLQSKGF